MGSNKYSFREQSTLFKWILAAVLIHIAECQADPNCKITIAQMNNDMCCPLELLPTTNETITLDLSAAIQLGKDDRGDTIYLGAVCDKEGILFQAANLYEFSSGYRQSTIYYAYGSDAISSPETAYIVQNKHKCVIDWFPIRPDWNYDVDKLSSIQRWFPRFFSGDFGKSLVGRAIRKNNEQNVTDLIVRYEKLTANTSSTNKWPYFYIQQNKAVQFDNTKHPHELLYVDCLKNTQQLLSTAELVNYTINQNHGIQSLENHAKRQVKDSVLLNNDSPLTIVETLTKCFKYDSVVEQTLDNNSIHIEKFDVGGQIKLNFKFFFSNFMTGITLHTEYDSDWNTTIMQHSSRKYTNIQIMKTTKEIRVPPFSKSTIDIVNSALLSPPVPYESFMKLKHETLSANQVLSQLKYQNVDHTCSIEDDLVVCKLSGTLRIDASMGIDFVATGQNSTSAHQSSIRRKLKSSKNLVTRT